MSSCKIVVTVVLAFVVALAFTDVLPVTKEACVEPPYIHDILGECYKNVTEFENLPQRHDVPDMADQLRNQIAVCATRKLGIIDGENIHLDRTLSGVDEFDASVHAKEGIKDGIRQCKNDAKTAEEYAECSFNAFNQYCSFADLDD